MDHHVKLWAHTICALLLLAAPAASAQAPPTFRDSVEVSVISVDVFVEDREGNRVHGLTADDFILLEDRQPQPITNFSEYKGGADVSDTHTRPGSVELSPSPEEVTRPPRTVVLFVDPFHQNPENRKELFTRMHAFLRTALDPGDRAAVLAWRRGVREIVPLTDDLDLVERGLASLSGLQLPEPGAGLDAARDFFEETEDFEAGIEALAESEFDDISVDEEMEFVIRNCAEQRMSEMRSKTSALQRIIGSLAGVEGRKALIYLAGRFPADTQIYCRGSDLGSDMLGLIG